MVLLLGEVETGAGVVGSGVFQCLPTPVRVHTVPNMQAVAAKPCMTFTLLELYIHIHDGSRLGVYASIRRIGLSFKLSTQCWPSDVDTKRLRDFGVEY